jgi:hypothetical protein
LRVTDVKTVFGALGDHQKGGVEVIKDDPKNYVFSNVFEVAEKSKPYERVAVGKNFEYVIETLRAARPGHASGSIFTSHASYGLALPQAQRSPGCASSMA